MEAIEDCFNVDDDVPIAHSLTDQEFCDTVFYPIQKIMMMMISALTVDYVNKPRAKNIYIDKCISLTDDLIMELEQKKL